jgi:hypothetical protein
VLGPLAVLHPVQHVGEQQPLAHLSGRGARLSLHGEVADRLADDVFTALFDLACAAPGQVQLHLPTWPSSISPAPARWPARPGC